MFCCDEGRGFTNGVRVQLVYLQRPTQGSSALQYFTLHLLIAGFMEQTVDGLPDRVEGLKLVEISAAFASRIGQFQYFNVFDHGPMRKPGFFTLADGKE